MSPERRTRDQPSVFLSFAGTDRPKAETLADALRRHDRHAFVDDDGIPFGRNVVGAIEHQLTQSDYFVLLWSQHTADRPWVEVEWTAALTKEVNERRSFLFVVRLDDSALPITLAPRRYLDGRGDLGTVAKQLAQTWDADRSTNAVVLPAPVAQPLPDAGMTLYVRNRAYATAHALPVPTGCTGTQLRQRIAVALDLPDDKVRFNGMVGVRLAYAFEVGGEPLADGPLSDQGLTDESEVDLIITTELHTTDQPVSTFQLRDANPGGLTERTAHSLVNRALAHLRPW